MKQVLLSFFLLFSANAFAQQGFVREGDENYTEMQDSLFAPLNKSIIPYGYLDNRVYPWTQLDEWQSGNTTSMYGLFQTWFDVEQSYVGVQSISYRYQTMRDSVAAQMRKL